MSKLTKRKSIVEVGKRCPTNYEIHKSNREQAMKVAEKCDPKIKEPIKFDLKR